MTLTKPHIAIRHSAYRATISSLKYIIKGVVAAIHIIYIYIFIYFRSFFIQSVTDSLFKTQF